MTTVHKLELMVQRRKEKEARERKAEAQAAKDSLLIKEPVEVNLKEGKTPSLAELNAIAEEANDELRDTAHEAAVQVARVTKDVLRGVGVGSKQHTRRAKAANATQKLSTAAATDKKLGAAGAGLKQD